MALLATVLSAWETSSADHQRASMSKASMHFIELGHVRSSGRMIDACAIIPILACAYPTIVGPLIYFTFPPAAGLQGLMESRTEQRIFWPAMAAISVVLIVRNYSRLGRFIWPPHIIYLFVYVAFAGASVLWAFRPQLSFIRFVQEVMVIISIILPAMLAVRSADIMRGLFLCFALAAILNVFFVFGNSPALVAILKGYPGYFTGKNLLGEFAAIAFLLSLHEVFQRGLRRALGIIIIIIDTLLLFWANSKTAFALALVVPFLAGLILFAARRMRISPAIILFSVPLCYVVLSSVSGFHIMDRASYILYGDPTFTGRSVIWDFALNEIARRPLLGWGYQSFWLVGPDAPSVVDAPGWVKSMPNAHNGYYDTMLEMGYVGYALLLAFIITTLHAIGRVSVRDPTRAWLLFSLALYVIIHNGLESTWMRAFDLMWVVFAIVAAETGRQLQPLTLRPLSPMARTLRPRSSAGVIGRPRPGPSPGRRRPANAQNIGYRG
jgi:exopolysaccharide production protein ExoQ